MGLQLTRCSFAAYCNVLCCILRQSCNNPVAILLQVATRCNKVATAFLGGSCISLQRWWYHALIAAIYVLACGRDCQTIAPGPSSDGPVTVPGSPRDCRRIAPRLWHLRPATAPGSPRYCPMIVPRRAEGTGSDGSRKSKVKGNGVWGVPPPLKGFLDPEPF